MPQTLFHYPIIGCGDYNSTIITLSAHIWHPVMLLWQQHVGFKLVGCLRLLEGSDGVVGPAVHLDL